MRESGPDARLLTNVVHVSNTQKRQPFAFSGQMVLSCEYAICMKGFQGRRLMDAVWEVLCNGIRWRDKQEEREDQAVGQETN
jgi:hypothetical protein